MSDTIYNEYYVYAWLKKDGSVYYIGKGKGKRAYRKGCGKIQIIASNLSERDAFDFESLLIKTIGRKDLNEGPLHNRNNGMIGGDTSQYIDYSKRKSLVANLGERFKGHSHNGTKAGKNNPMWGKFGYNNGKTANARLVCPICKMESNSSNIKRHITKTHNMDWRKCLNRNS